jgi:hypothetical protein
MKKTLQIYILSCDRANLLEEALESVLVQDDSEVDLEIVVSDNSKTNAVQNLLSSYSLSKTKVRYIRHLPQLSQEEHFYNIMDQCTADYLVMFHDDDIMHPDYVKVMCPILTDSNLVALGCNGFQFRDKSLNNFKKMHHCKSLKIFNNKKDFLECYLVSNGGVAPYPGYIYKTEYLKKIPLTSLRSSKHGDVVFLSSFIDFGSIGWLPDALIYYRIHSSSSSSSENILDRKLLLRFMFSQGVDPRSTPVFLYIYLYYLNWLRQQGSFFLNIYKWRYKIVAKFILFNFFSLLSTSYFWRTVLKKLRIIKYN